MDRSVLFTLIAAILVLLLIIELVRQRRLKEEFSLLWLGIGILMILLSLWRDALHGLSKFVGIAYPPNLLFLVAVLFIFFIMLHFSTVLTRLIRENKESAQQIAILREELNALRGNRHNGHSEQDNESDSI